jgi:multiple RNA-binding domain-containing protein 1
LLNVKDGLSSGDAAVRLALGETQIIQENRDYFASHGIDMDALVSVKPSSSTDSSGEKKNLSGKRSASSFLVKNLPYDTTVEELTKLFHFGAVEEEDSFRVLLPPSRTIALVTYNHSSDAKKAFRKMAYRRFKHVPIYLEWAPLSADNATRQGTTKPSGGAGEGVSSNVSQQRVNKQVADQEADNPEEEMEEGTGTSTTIYVKNLNFRTTEEDLRLVFERQGRVRAVKIPQKVAPMAQGDGEVQSMSMGYGFVEMESSSLVHVALKKLQGKLVDGHALELKLSNNLSSSSMPDPKKAAKKEKNPTKLLVKNVPFQATRKELVKLFGSFGQLRTVRLPKKFDGTHRGFAFVEYLASKDAVESITALSRTHLYGRHLVLDWASKTDEEEKGTAELRETSAKRPMIVIDNKKPMNKKIRFD